MKGPHDNFLFLSLPSLITEEIDALHKSFTPQSPVSTFAFPESDKIDVLDMQLH